MRSSQAHYASLAPPLKATIIMNTDDDILMTMTVQTSSTHPSIHPHSSTYGRDVSFVNIVIVLHDSFSSGGQALDHDQQRPSITGSMMMMTMMMMVMVLMT